MFKEEKRRIVVVDTSRCITYRTNNHHDLVRCKG